MNRAERRRLAANRRALREIARMSGGVIEAEIIRQGDAPCDASCEALLSFLTSASRAGTRCLHCHAHMRPPVSWPGSFFAAYGAFGEDRMARTLIMPVCPACTELADIELFESAHSVMAAAYPQIKRIVAAHVHREGGRA